MKPICHNTLLIKRRASELLGREVREFIFISQFVFRLFHGSSRFLSKMFHVIDLFRFCLNCKTFTGKTLYYKKLFLSLQRLRIGGQLEADP